MHCIYTINYAILINIHLHINNYSKIKVNNTIKNHTQFWVFKIILK